MTPFFFLSPLDRATLADFSLPLCAPFWEPSHRLFHHDLSVYPHCGSNSVPKCSLLFIQIEKMLYHPVACVH